MKIESIAVYQVDLPLAEGSYHWSGGNFVETFDSTLVQVRTDDGLTGWGEVCPLGPAYLPAYAHGVRAGIREIGAGLLGLNPLALGQLNQRMDALIKGHPYVKSAIDMACWDLLGQTSGLPICELMGGRYGANFILYRAISQGTPEEMAASVARYREEGYRRFQLKVGANSSDDIDRIQACRAMLSPGDRLIADANTGWTSHDALRVANAVQDLDVDIEQPCRTYEECLRVRQAISLPFVLDEVIDGIDKLTRGHADQAMDIVNIKISKFGGLTKAKLARDLCIELGLAMTIEDSWGGDLTTAAIAHLAHSTPPQWLFTSTDFNSYVTRNIAEGAPQRIDGRLAAPTRPGLGCAPDLNQLEDPLFEICN